MPEIDEISEALGGLRQAMKDIASDVKETREMIDATIPTIAENAKFINSIRPLIPTLENLDTGRKITKWGLAAMISLGSANLLVPLWSYIKAVLVTAPHIAPGP